MTKTKKTDPSHKTPKAKYITAIFIAFLLGYLVRTGCAPVTSSPDQTKPVSTTASEWTCSMHPEVRSSKPGKCPKCAMDLIPVETELTQTDSAAPLFKTTEQAKALMQIEVTPVQRKFPEADIRMVGRVEYDETKLAYITAWVPGRLDRLFIDYTGVSVRKGDHMVYIYSPQLLTAQTELIQALQSAESLNENASPLLRQTAQTKIDAVREKLRLLGLTPQQIKDIETTKIPSDHMTIYSPAEGIVVEKNAQQGMYVQTGTRIYTIADLLQVWVKLDAYESDLSWLRYGQKVEFTTVSYPGQTFTGTIAFIDPVLNEKTRTVKVRVNAPNSDSLLKPGMFVKAIVRPKLTTAGKVMEPALAGKWICPMHPDIIKETAGSCDICEMPLVTTESLGYVSIDPEKSQMPLLIPASAPLITGKRAIVYIQDQTADKPTYNAAEITLGPKAGDYYIVTSGLTEGQLVVTKGNFKIDSALQIQAKPSMMSPPGSSPDDTAPPGGHSHDHN